MTIRKYRPDDREFLIRLWEMTFPDRPQHNRPAKMIDSKLAFDDMIFVAEQDGRIVGACMACYDGHRGWLYAVAVLPECRLDGIGTALVEHSINALREIGCVKVNLQIRSTNKSVAAFYQSLGFAVEDRLSMGLRI